MTKLVAEDDHNERLTPQNELSLAGEYCTLFVSSAEASSQETVSNTQTYGEDGDENEAPSVDKRDFWVHDNWNDEELNRAQEILNSNLEKCWISALDRNSEVDNDGEAWDKFYSNHGTRFFKDRHYLERAFPDDFHKYESASARMTTVARKKTLVEIGCGVGNAILPMMDDERQQEETISSGMKKIRWGIIHGLDISKEAITLMKQDPRFVNAHSNERAFGHVCDITVSVPTNCLASADVATLLFCLSAIDPDKMPGTARNVASILKQGGTLLFRDYGRFDEAQMKLGVSRSKCIKDNFYRKHDGTKCYYFALEDLENLFTDAGLRVLELKYLQRVYTNLKSQEKRRRVWVHGRFLKP